MTAEDRSRFIRLIQDACPPMKTEIPALPPLFEERLYSGGKAPLHGIRAVLFDVYGTLFSSAAGDIAVHGAYSRGSLDDLALSLDADCTGEELKDYFRKAVLERHEKLFARTPFPEVRTEEIWAAFPGRPEYMSGEELALRYELSLNPVYPMPGAQDCLRMLQNAGVMLGIISNAQFFTPLLFDAFFGSGPEALGFAPGLQVYSYEIGEAKPSPALFSGAMDVLGGSGIKAQEALYIGNDMLNDICGAASAGFKTVLFAGDKRSLRLREGNRLIRNMLPDAVISDLIKLPGLFQG